MLEEAISVLLDVIHAEMNPMMLYKVEDASDEEIDKLKHFIDSQRPLVTNSQIDLERIDSAIDKETLNEAINAVCMYVCHECS